VRSGSKRVQAGGTVMTEEQWLNARQNAQSMMWNLRLVSNVTRTKRGRRKLRLFACGCCRLVWERLADPRLRKAVQVAEEVAEGTVSRERLATVCRRVSPLMADGYFPKDPGLLNRIAVDMAVATTSDVAFYAAFSMTCCMVPLAGYGTDNVDAEAALCNLIRCVFGNPFRSISFTPAWRTPEVSALAHTAYEERRWEDLPLLADALEEAGSADEAILSHLRGPGPHARGCWVVDLILARA
jgi:hypothetical protein